MWANQGDQISHSYAVNVITLLSCTGWLLISQVRVIRPIISFHICLSYIKSKLQYMERIILFKSWPIPAKELLARYL